MTLGQLGELGGLAFGIYVLVVVIPDIFVKVSRRYGQDDLQIPPFNVKVRFDKADESLPKLAAWRRAQAETLRRASQRVRTGDPTQFETFYQSRANGGQ